MTIKVVYQSISASLNFLNMHQNYLVLETVTGTPLLPHTAPVSLLTTFPSQNYPHHMIVYAHISTKA